MKIITLTISKRHDRLLEAIAPKLLRGKRMTSRRIEWAINRLDVLLIAENDRMNDKAGRPSIDEPTTSPGTSYTSPDVT